MSPAGQEVKDGREKRKRVQELFPGFVPPSLVGRADAHLGSVTALRIFQW